MNITMLNLERLSLADMKEFVEANRKVRLSTGTREDGYLYISMQLPNASSEGRTSAAAAQVEQILANTPGV